MKRMFVSAGAMVLSLSLLAAAQAAGEPEMKVTLSDMHICCKGCVGAIEKAAAKVKGVKSEVNQDESQTVLTAATRDELQKAVDEIAKAGFYGDSNVKEIAMKPIKTPKGKVTKLEVAHIHNCCGKCTEALTSALKDVKGVTSNTLKAKKDTFVIEGDFSAEEAIKSLEKAGFYPELEKSK